MDPYLEARWSDFHATFIALLKEALQPSLPRSLRARTEERVLLEEADDEWSQAWKPDVTVVDTGLRERGQSPSGAAVAVPAPIYLELLNVPLIDRFVQIVDVTNGNRIITAIEVLSPWNKSSGRLNRDYLRKLDDYGRAGVSLVEIDLLRSSREHLKVKEADIPENSRQPYLVSLRRAWIKRWEVYPMGLRQALPAIPIPLREMDQEIVLPLQPLIDRVYNAGGHDDINYKEAADPPLAGDDAAWADQLLRAAGKR
jgi:hypothetical protein